jgi:DNA-nicking Smr family endonuclease
MTPMDPHARLAAIRGAEYEADAAHHRRVRTARRAGRGPSPVLRLYTRLWWASRPRVAAWGPPPTARAA